MLQRGRVEDNVDAIHAACQFIPIANVSNEKMYMRMLQICLIQKKKIALVIVQADDLFGCISRVG